MPPDSTMASSDPHTIEPWLALATQWQQTLAAWTNWWVSSGHFESDGNAALDAPSPPNVAARAPFDADRLAALHASFAPRVQALWAQAAHATPLEDDRRFASKAWREQPYFAWLAQAYRLYGEYLTALASLAQLPANEKRRLEFVTHQFVDAIAPSNFPATNPDVIARAIETDGKSIVLGLGNLAADIGKGRITMSDESAFEVGRNLAITPGSVVLRNDLIELIQYDATTPRVAKRPLLIVPPCINKYYILDLRPENSFVRHAVDQGHTVFIVSWRNIPAELGTLTWDDYLAQGILAALTAAKSITRSRQVNTLGFCVGGTLLACALAILSARDDDTAASATFLTTMLDFADPGEIGVFVTREMLAAREAQLSAGQRVHGSELAGAFASLRPNDLVWNYVVDNYLKGRKPPAFDLLYWNGDSANLPGPMYVYYIRQLYLENRLREPDALTMLGEKIDLSRIDYPAYIYASREDHIVPWHSAFRTLDLVGGATTFALGASGHIAGVVNPPEAHKRNYWTNDAHRGGAGDWFANATSHPGSWWPHWYGWLAQYKGGERKAPAHAGNATYRPLGPAPGEYVREQVD